MKTSSIFLKNFARKKEKVSLKRYSDVQKCYSLLKEEVNPGLPLQQEVLGRNWRCYSKVLFNFHCVYLPLSAACLLKHHSQVLRQHGGVIYVIFPFLSSSSILAVTKSKQDCLPRFHSWYHQSLASLFCSIESILSLQDSTTWSPVHGFFPGPANWEGCYKVCESRAPWRGRGKLTAL